MDKDVSQIVLKMEAANAVTSGQAPSEFLQLYAQWQEQLLDDIYAGSIPDALYDQLKGFIAVVGNDLPPSLKGLADTLTHVLNDIDVDVSTGEKYAALQLQSVGYGILGNIMTVMGW
jgi:hypothetical protein